jgi:hypothetical protein
MTRTNEKRFGAGTTSRLRTLLNAEKLAYISLTAKRLARLVALFRSTQERGFASLFHLSAFNSLSVIAAIAQLCQDK